MLFFLLVLQVLPIYLQGLHVPYNTLTCTVHVNKPTVQPVASQSLFLDVQIVTLLLGEFNLATNRPWPYFSAIIVTHVDTYDELTKEKLKMY